MIKMGTSKNTILIFLFLTTVEKSNKIKAIFFNKADNFIKYLNLIDIEK